MAELQEHPELVPSYGIAFSSQLNLVGICHNRGHYFSPWYMMFLSLMKAVEKLNLYANVNLPGGDVCFVLCKSFTPTLGRI